MIRIKHKELAALLGVSVPNSRIILHRAGLKISNKYLNEIIGLVLERKCKDKCHTKSQD